MSGRLTVTILTLPSACYFSVSRNNNCMLSPALTTDITTGLCMGLSAESQRRDTAVLKSMSPSHIHAHLCGTVCVSVALYTQSFADICEINDGNHKLAASHRHCHPDQLRVPPRLATSIAPYKGNVWECANDHVSLSTYSPKILSLINSNVQQRHIPMLITEYIFRKILQSYIEMWCTQLCYTVLVFTLHMEVLTMSHTTS